MDFWDSGLLPKPALRATFAEVPFQLFLTLYGGIYNLDRLQSPRYVFVRSKSGKSDPVCIIAMCFHLKLAVDDRSGGECCNKLPMDAAVVRQWVD